MYKKNSNKNQNAIKSLKAAIYPLIAIMATATLSPATKAGELYIGQLIDKSERVTYEPTLRDKYSPGCFSADRNYRHCQKILSREREVETKARYMIAYGHKGYTAGILNDDRGDNAFFAEKKFSLAEFYSVEFSLGAGLTYSESEDLKVYAAPEISYTRYKVKPTIMLLSDSVALSLKIEI